MSSPIRPAIAIFLGLTVLCGIAYPVVVTLSARALFPRQAAGSLLQRHSQTVGSRLIAQPTEDVRYFWGRLSATGDYPGNAANSGGSNLAPSNPDLRKAAAGRLEALAKADPDNHEAVPSDLVTASGSGLDPHISPRAARYQAARVARARGLDPAKVAALIASHSEKPQWGLFGEPRVNVLELNLALDELP